jgi:hypothetical protein
MCSALQAFYLSLHALPKGTTVLLATDTLVGIGTASTPTSIQLWLSPSLGALASETGHTVLAEEAFEQQAQALLALPNTRVVITSSLGLVRWTTRTSIGQRFTRVLRLPTATGTPTPFDATHMLRADARRTVSVDTLRAKRAAHPRR